MASAEEAQEILIQTLHNHSFKEVRAAAAEGLGWIGGERARAELIKALQEANFNEIKAAAAIALGRASQG